MQLTNAHGTTKPLPTTDTLVFFFLLRLGSADLYAGTVVPFT